MQSSGMEVWRGGVNPWQCDQMGHLNVRFYAAHAGDGLAGVAALLGMGKAFSPHATSTLVVREHHIRFFREARVGDALHLNAGLTALGEDDARVQLTLFHSLSGEPAAIFQTHVAHARATDAVAFPWSSRVRERAAALMVATPEGMGPRSLPPGEGRTDASVQAAETAGMARHATGVFGPRDADPFGRVAPAEIMGRLSDGAAHAIAAMRAALSELIPGRPPIGMAVMEYRLTYLDTPLVGDRYDVRSAWTRVEPRRLRFEHWVLDPDTGRPWAVAEVVLVVFDLDKRKTVTMPEEAVAALQAHVREL